MTKSNHRFITSLLLASFLGASPSNGHAQSIDASSKKSFQASVDTILAQVSDADKKCFQSGLFDMILTEHPKSAGKSSNEMLIYLGENPLDYPDYLDGVTKSEIIARGEEVSECEAQGNVSNDGVPPSASTQDALKACVTEKISVSNLKVEKARYGDEINFTVTNSLDWAISGIRVEYSVASPERSIPWVQDNESTSISGGIEAGESRDLSISITGINGSIPEELNREQLVAVLKVVDVADSKGDQLVHDVNVIGGNWSGKTSIQKCD